MHRLVNRVIALVVVVGIVAPVFAQDPSNLTAEELKAIVAKPRDEQPVLKGLEILPKVQNWESSGHFIDAQGKREPFKGKTTSKHVEGKYEVNRINFEGHSFALVMVVTWDAKSGMYYKYTVNPRGPASKSLGMRVPNTRAIAWADAGNGGVGMITIETYEDQKMAWRSMMVDKAGAVTLTTDGEATAAKP